MCFFIRRSLDVVVIVIAVLTVFMYYFHWCWCYYCQPYSLYCFSLCRHFPFQQQCSFFKWQHQYILLIVVLLLVAPLKILCNENFFAGRKKQFYINSNAAARGSHIPYCVSHATCLHVSLGMAHASSPSLLCGDWSRRLMSGSLPFGFKAQLLMEWTYYEERACDDDIYGSSFYTSCFEDSGSWNNRTQSVRESLMNPFSSFTVRQGLGLSPSVSSASTTTGAIVGMFL